MTSFRIILRRMNRRKASRWGALVYSASKYVACGYGATAREALAKITKKIEALQADGEAR